MKFINMYTILATALLLVSADVFSASAENTWDLGEHSPDSSKKPPIWESEAAYREELSSLRVAAKGSKTVKGDHRAAFHLGCIWTMGGKVLMDDKSTYLKVGISPEKGAEYFKKAVDLGLADLELREVKALDFALKGASINLITLYSQGLIKGHDLEAVKYYKILAEDGYVRAQYNFGLCLTNGHGIAVDKAEGLKWIERAASQDHPDAQAFLNKLPKEVIFGVGIAYKFGYHNVSRDEAQAQIFLNLAARRGCQAATDVLAGVGVKALTSLMPAWADLQMKRP